MKQTKVLGKIEQAKGLTAQMKVLKTNTQVAEYIALEAERKTLHKDITAHIDQYNVNAEKFKSVGLIGTNSRWVKVEDLEVLAEVKPKLKSILLPLINEKMSYYTR